MRENEHESITRSDLDRIEADDEFRNQVILKIVPALNQLSAIRTTLFVHFGIPNKHNPNIGLVTKLIECDDDRPTSQIMLDVLTYLVDRGRTARAPRREEPTTLFMCPLCRGPHFHVGLSGQLVCSSAISGEKIGCGWKGRMKESEAPDA